MALNDKPQMQHLPLNRAQDFSGQAQLVTDDRRFNPCVALNSGETLTLNLSTAPNKPATLSVWFKRQSPVSQIQLGPTAAHVRIGADGTVAAYQNQQLQGQPFVPLNSAAKVTDNQWHYLTWVKQADQHTLYLNGIVCATRTLPAVLTPAAVTTITVLGGVVRLAQLHYYPRALTVTEVLADQHSQNQAQVTFVDQYPLDFALAHIQDDRWKNFADNTLVVEDVSAKERLRQHLKITNVSREAVEFSAGQGDAGSDNCHFELRLRHGTFSEPQTYPRFTGLVSASRRPLANWSIIRAATQNADDGSWSVYLLSTEHLVLASGAALVFPFEYTTADGSLGGRSTRVALHYQKMQFKAGQPVQGTREKSVDIMNLSSNNSYLRQVNARVSKADSKVDHLEGSVKKDIKSLENLAKAEEDTGALQEFASKQGKQNKSKGKSSKIKPIDAGKKGQSFASAVVATIKSLAANVGALDDEVDERAKATAVIQDQLEKPFPLVASVRTPPEGMSCNNRCDFTFEITNRSDTAVDLKDGTPNPVTVTFTVPIGGGANCLTVKDVGQVDEELAKTGRSSNTFTVTLIKFKPTKEAKTLASLPARQTVRLEIKGCTPNSVPGTAMVQVKYSGLDGYPSALSTQIVPITKIANRYAFLPVGSIYAFPARVDKDKEDLKRLGFLVCDGGSYRREDYKDLSEFLWHVPKNEYGGSSGSTFKVPDYSGLFLRGYGGNSHDIGAKQPGATALPKNKNFQTNDSGYHAHSISSNGSHSHNIGLKGEIPGRYGGWPRRWVWGIKTTDRWWDGILQWPNRPYPQLAYCESNGNHGHTIYGAGGHSHQIESGGDIETRPENYAVIYVIKY